MSIVFSLRDLIIGWHDAPLIKVTPLDFSTAIYGNKLAITGATGLGKSTLMYVLAGLKAPAAGGCRWQLGDKYDLTPQFNAINANQLNVLLKQQFGFMFQNSRMLPLLTIADSLRYSLRFIGWQNKQIEVAVKKVLAQMSINQDLIHLADCFPYQLSGGQLQRAALAHAIVHEPKVLFADEPTASLDEKSRLDIMQVIDDWLGQKLDRLFVWVTHHESECANTVALHVTVNQQNERVFRLKEANQPELCR